MHSEHADLASAAVDFLHDPCTYFRPLCSIKHMLLWRARKCEVRRGEKEDCGGRIEGVVCRGGRKEDESLAV